MPSSPPLPPPFPADPAAFAAAREGAVVAPLPGTTFVDVTGADAQAFLQGQLSNDVAALEPGAVQWSTYNSPKGRMLATLLVGRRSGGEGFRLALATDLAEPVRKRLAMYVLRSKAALAPPVPPLAAIGVGGPKAREAVAAALGVEVKRAHAVAFEAGEAIGLPDGRVLLAVAQAERLATQEKHIAQTANWEVVGGISFAKGCYPGQEIVARVQHLGILKERAYPFHADAPPPEPNAPLYVAGTDQKAGLVVDAVATPGGGSDLIAVVHLAALEGDLRLGTPDGPPLAQLPLPYALPASAPKRVKL